MEKVGKEEEDAMMENSRKKEAKGKEWSAVFLRESGRKEVAENAY